MSQYLAIARSGDIFVEESDIAVQRACEQELNIRFYRIYVDEFGAPSLGARVTIRDYLRREKQNDEVHRND